MNDPEPTDDERYPTLTEHGRTMLDFLREHPHAPLYRNRSGNRLTADEVQQIRTHCDEVGRAPLSWKPDVPPAWLADFAAHCYAEVPHYRQFGSVPGEFTDIEPVSRADFSRDIAAFVPDSVEVERMINFRTSGTSGHPLLLPSHPVVAASYLAYHMRALQRFGITLRAQRGDVGVVLLGMQRKCFTYVSVTPVLDDAGLAKINLHPNDWRNPADRAPYLDALNPEVIAGDPISFAELLTLPVTCLPAAILCTSMALLPALRSALEARFRCPVLDLYSMNEAGPIAVFDPAENGHVLLQPRMFVEILDDAGHRVPPGTRGEIVLTGGFNFCLPLLRYRTGDFASLDVAGDVPVLRDFSGRPPVRFRAAGGEWLNNIEVTHALRDVPLPQWTMHQQADGAIIFRHSGARACDAEVARILQALLGDVPVRVESAVFDSGKVVQYTTAFD
jgi:phenylacetate-CoA ligase